MTMNPDIYAVLRDEIFPALNARLFKYGIVLRLWRERIVGGYEVKVSESVSGTTEVMNLTAVIKLVDQRTALETIKREIQSRPGCELLGTPIYNAIRALDETIGGLVAHESLRVKQSTILNPTSTIPPEDTMNHDSLCCDKNKRLAKEGDTISIHTCGSLVGEYQVTRGSNGELQIDGHDLFGFYPGTYEVLANNVLTVSGGRKGTDGL